MKYSNKDQSGLVSIMVASVLMVIMALITLGFTRLVSNEQRQSIDNQLSKQAFYAAESGINVVARLNDLNSRDKSTCDVAEFDNGRVIDDTDTTNDDVSFTCILINSKPNDIVFNNDAITTDHSKIIPINTDNTVNSITFSWNDTNDEHNTIASCSSEFKKNSTTPPDQWTSKSLLKLDLIKIPTGSLNNQVIIDNQFSAILFPCNQPVPSPAAPTTVDFTSAQGSNDIGRIIPVHCDTSINTDGYECSLRIIDNNGALSRNFYARFNSIFGNVNLRITASDGSGGLTRFSNVQAVVDSTGKSGDVFRRLQARVPLYNSFDYPNGALQSLNEVCKKYSIFATNLTTECN